MQGPKVLGDIIDSHFEEHFNSVQLVLQDLDKAMLKLKLKKCKWCSDNIDVWGHTFNAEGLRIQLRTIDKFEHFLKQQSLQGVCNCYIFFPDIPKQLYDLTWRGVKLYWFRRSKENINSSQAIDCIIHLDFTSDY